MLEIRNVCKKYDRKVLDDVNLVFGDTGFYCLIGDSGSGKSTLLNIMAGIENPDEGCVFYNNRDISLIDRSYYNNKIVSYIFQSYNLIDKYSVRENVLLPVKIRKDKINVDLDDIFGALKIRYLIDRKVSRLSGGEKQRVAIARSLVQDSRIILADEPTGALDSSNSLRIMSILKRISRDKLVIVVTHNRKLAYRFADGIISIKDGVVDVSDVSCINSDIDDIGCDRFRFRFFDKMWMAIKNLVHKRLRNFLTVLAFMIGLFSLGLVLSISNGFNKELDSLNRSSLFTYPLIISRVNYVDNINSSVSDRNGINVKDSGTVKNVFDDKLFDLVNGLGSDLVSGIGYVRDIDDVFRSVSMAMPNSDFFEVVDGRMPVNSNEVVVLVDDDDAIGDDVYNYLNVEKNGVINNSFIVDGKSIVVCGVVRSNNDYFSSMSGILYSNDLFDEDILDIYIYVRDLDSKDRIKDVLSDYYVRDDAEEVTSVLSNLVDGISVVLVLFSMISLIVSVIMIWVISYVSVIERLRDIGIYKCLGYRNNDIRNLFVFENIIIGFISWLFGVLFIYVVSNIINGYVDNLIGIDGLVCMDNWCIVLLLVVSLVLCYFASLIPAIIGSRKKVVDIINS